VARGQKQQSSIRDVAARVGVGVGTVSRVLNDSPHVSEKTRRRVHAAIEELGFRPSFSARRLSLGSTQTVGVVAPFFTQSSVVERLRGISEVIGESAYDLTIFNVESPEQRAHALDSFAHSDRLDGLIVISLALDDDEVARLQDEELPIVLIDVDDRRLPHVATDDVAGGRLAGQYLLDAGHRRIAFVGFPERNPFGMVSTSRRDRGLRAALKRAGLGLPKAYVKRGGPGREAARRITAELLALDEPPTAIFAASDIQAVGVAAVLEEAGVAVPRDVSVIGFDDIELARAVGLTTVRQGLRSSGRRGAQLLLGQLDPAAAPPVDPAPALEIVERRTVGPPRRDGRVHAAAQ
jgi:LacI family transcriptional regulator